MISDPDESKRPLRARFWDGDGSRSIPGRRDVSSVGLAYYWIPPPSPGSLPGDLAFGPPMQAPSWLNPGAPAFFLSPGGGVAGSSRINLLTIPGFLQAEGFGPVCTRSAGLCGTLWPGGPLDESRHPPVKFRGRCRQRSCIRVHELGHAFDGLLGAGGSQFVNDALSNGTWPGWSGEKCCARTKMYPQVNCRP